MNDGDTKEEASAPSTGKAITSLLGLVVIGVAVYYGLPHLRDTLGSLTSRENVPEVEATSVSTPSETPQVTAAEPKSVNVTETPVAKALKLNPSDIQLKVKEAIEVALKKPHRENFTMFVAAEQSKDLKFVRAQIKIDENSYVLLFKYSDEFGKHGEFKADVEDAECAKFFTMSPCFTVTK